MGEKNVSYIARFKKFMSSFTGRIFGKAVSDSRKK